jgi:hypothetical protein
MNGPPPREGTRKTDHKKAPASAPKRGIRQQAGASKGLHVSNSHPCRVLYAHMPQNNLHLVSQLTTPLRLCQANGTGRSYSKVARCVGISACCGLADRIVRIDSRGRKHRACRTCHSNQSRCRGRNLPIHLKPSCFSKGVLPTRQDRAVC